MASSTAKPMPRTIEAYKKLAQDDLDLIDKLLEEIADLKKINRKLTHRANKLTNTIKKLRIKQKESE